MTNARILNCINTLNAFANMRLPVRISNVILRNSKLLQKEYEVYEKQLNMIYDSYDKYMIKDEKGNNIDLSTPEKLYDYLIKELY